MIKSKLGVESSEIKSGNTKQMQKEEVMERITHERIISSGDMEAARRAPAEILKFVRENGEVSADQLYALAPTDLEIDGVEIVKSSIEQLIRRGKIARSRSTDSTEDNSLAPIVYRTAS